MWAAADLEKMRLLVSAGAGVNAKSDDLRTPLMIAARKPGWAAQALSESKDVVASRQP